MPLIGEKAPSFEAETTQGPINFPEDFKGKWVVFFSHPADFTPVCTTEFMTFASMQKEFKSLNTELLGLSIDSTFSHIAWLRTIKEKIQYKGMKDVEVLFPVISDLTMEVSKKVRYVAAGCQHYTGCPGCVYYRSESYRSCHFVLPAKQRQKYGRDQKNGARNATFGRISNCHPGQLETGR